MTVNFSGLSVANKGQVIDCGGDFTKTLLTYVRDNPIGLSRGMNYRGRTIRGTVTGNTIVITSI